MKQTLDHLGAIGLSKDQFANDVAPQGWSDAKNMRFRNGYAEKFSGHRAVYDPPAVIPYWLQPMTTPAGRFWIYAGAGSIHCVTNATHTDITKVATTYSGSLNGWTGGVLTGIAIMNNGVDTPQYWAGVPATPCADLLFWPANTQCASMRVFRNFLVAMNVTKSGTNYPYMVKWSTEADPGTLPGSWDQTDPTKDAGEYDLSEDQSKLIDGLPLGDVFILYKESSIYAMQYIGSPYIFRFQKLTDAAGLLCRNAVVSYPGGHVFISQGDIMQTSGGTPQSLLTGRMKRYFANALDSANYAQSFCSHNPTQNEVWMCYPKTGATYCTEAIVWNYLDNTLSIRDLPNCTHAVCGVVDYSITNSWASDTETWQQDATAWNSAEFTQSAQRLLMASADTKIYIADVSTTANGTPFNAVLERTGLDFGDASSVKTIKSVRPRIDAAPGTVLNIRIGGAMDLEGGIMWTSTIPFTVGTDYEACGFATGRYLGIRIENTAPGSWRMQSMDVDFSVTSLY